MFFVIGIVFVVGLVFDFGEIGDVVLFFNVVRVVDIRIIL